MPCLTNGTLTICRTPGRTKVIGRAIKWCFKCRKRGEHKRVVFYPESSWYEPTVSWECPMCKRDFTLFPGWEYLDDEEP